MSLLAAVRQRSLQIAFGAWVLLTVVGFALSRGDASARFSVLWSCGALAVLLIEIGIAALIIRRRPLPDLGERAPARNIAIQETVGMWLYGAIVLVAGRIIGLHYFGEGIALHLNGSLVGATRVQSPIEVCTWAAYNGILLALISFAVFRRRGYSNWALNLKSANLKNDVLVIIVLLADEHWT